ncbi:MAG: SRPBCC family protein [Gaiellaceae bacterium]
MPSFSAERELLAPRADVWAFLAEPFHMSDWWPGITGIQPDRRGFSPGARWAIVGINRPSLLRKPNMSGALLVLEVEPLSRATWHLTGERMDVELRLKGTEPDRTLATLTVSAPWLVGLRRTLPRQALGRLHALCQTAATL